MLLLITSVITSILLLSNFQTISSLQCSSDSGPVHCRHSYNETLNETACVIWWKKEKPNFTERAAILPPPHQSCFSKNDFVDAFNSTDFVFAEKCKLQKYLMLAGFCFCKNGDFCNEKIINDSDVLDSLYNQMDAADAAGKF